MSTTNEKIIEAAKELFSTKGYAATTTKDIASLAGISEVTLFRHFENKRNLFQVALHGSFQSEKLLQFFNSEVEYDLDKDLKKLSKYLYDLYESNGPMIKMMLKDTEHGNFSEIVKPQIEHKFHVCRNEYFEKMYELGKISDDPIMCSRFFFSNAMGFLMRKFVLSKQSDDMNYYNWMIEKTISAIKTKNNT